MLGYEMGWAAFHVIEVMSSLKLGQKRMGYIAASQSFHAETEVLTLATNLLRKDLTAPHSVYDTGLALSALACFVTTDLAHDLTQDLMSLVCTCYSLCAMRFSVLLSLCAIRYSALCSLC